MITRRSLVMAAALAGTAGSPVHAEPDAAGTVHNPVAAARQKLVELERRHGGRLGVAIVDGSGLPPVHLRGDERFALCSTFKVLAAGFVLARVDAGKESLQRRIVYDDSAIIPYAPVTKLHVGEPGMTLGALCAAAVTISDNTAANLVLASFGGPAALTAWLRSIRDATTRLDDIEPGLNDVPPGATVNTTTPVAMAETMRRLLFGSVLSHASQARLEDWMVACETGGKRLRAGVPPGWRVGDKTGTFRNVCNDVAAMWPPRGRPRLVTAFYAGGDGTDADRDAVLAEVGRIAAGL